MVAEAPPPQESFRLHSVPRPLRSGARWAAPAQAARLAQPAGGSERS